MQEIMGFYMLEFVPITPFLRSNVVDTYFQNINDSPWISNFKNIKLCPCSI